MFLDFVFTVGKVDAKCLVDRNIRVLPLYGGAYAAQCFVRGPCCAAEFSRREITNAWNIAFDEVAFHFDILLFRAFGWQKQDP